MTTGAILLGIGLVLLVLLILARPFLRPQSMPVQSQQPVESLLQQKEALLAQIQALDFDLESGKLPAAAHEFERRQLIVAAAHLLRQAEQQQAAAADDDIVAQIEAAVSQIRAQKAAPASEPAGICPQCRQPVDVGDKFCAACGHQLIAKADTVS